jgi:hypothetical protein
MTCCLLSYHVTSTALSPVEQAHFIGAAFAIWLHKQVTNNHIDVADGALYSSISTLQMYTRPAFACRLQKVTMKKYSSGMQLSMISCELNCTLH